jgi:hypothetical protein
MSHRDQEGVMEAQDYPISHFALMERLARHLASIPAQILEHSYNYEFFGSWSFTFRRSGKIHRVLYNGKEFDVTLESAEGKSWKLISQTHVPTAGEKHDQAVFDFVVAGMDAL